MISPINRVHGVLIANTPAYSGLVALRIDEVIDPQSSRISQCLAMAEFSENKFTLLMWHVVHSYGICVSEPKWCKRSGFQSIKITEMWP